MKWVRRVFGTDSFGSNEKPKISFVLHGANKSGEEAVLLRKVFLLFIIEAKHNRMKLDKELTSVQ